MCVFIVAMISKVSRKNTIGIQENQLSLKKKLEHAEN